MRETAAAERYARALYLAVEESKGISQDDVRQGLVRTHKTISEDEKFRTDLMNPLLPFSRKKSMLRKKAGKAAEGIAGTFIDLLVEKKKAQSPSSDHPAV